MSRTRRTGTTTTTTKTTVRDLCTALREANLPPQEEQFVRMRFGIGALPTAKLEFRGQTNEESRVKLAMMEKELLDEHRNPQPPTDEYAARKDRIIRKLRGL